MFTYVGTVGEVAIIKENDRFYLAPNVSRIRIESDDSPEYISQYMRTEQFYKKVIFPLIATSSQPALSMENIRKFIICLPQNKEEQRQIAECLSHIDNLITLHQRKCICIKNTLNYMEIEIIIAKETIKMLESESAIEKKLIEQLVYGDSQWVSREDLKTENDL